MSKTVKSTEKVGVWFLGTSGWKGKMRVTVRVNGASILSGENVLVEIV